MNDTSATHPDRQVTACVVIIGNEILSGRTQDANLAFLAISLNDVGIQLREARVIPDVPEVIIATINEVRKAFDYVFTTGGIGPTHDDITAECIAAAFEVPLVIDQEARRRLEIRHGPEGLNEARLRMARVPEGATLIGNALSGAPGFQIGNVHVLAGVPVVARSMFDDLRPRLRGGARIHARTIVCNLPEGTIAAELSSIQDRWPAIEIGSYPAWHASGGFRLSLVLRGTDRPALAAAAAEIMEMIDRIGGEACEEGST